MQESQHSWDQVTFKASVLPHNSPAPRLFVLFLPPVDPVSRAVRLLLTEMNRDDGCVREPWSS